MVVGGGSGGALASMEDSAKMATGIFPFGFVTSASGEIQGTHLGLDYAYELTCEDEAGNALHPCDDTTDSAAVSVAWSGTLTVPPHLSAMVDRSGEWSIAGLQGDTATFDGTGSFELDATVQTGAVMRTYRLSSVSSYEQIVLDAISPPHVISGAIRYDIEGRHFATDDAGFEVEGSFEVTAQVTFEDGDATIVLDGERSYHLDCGSGQVTFMGSGSFSSP